MAFNRLAYPDHPYSVPTRGFADTVSELKLSQLRRFHREQLGPRGMVIAIVGAVSPGEALEAARARLEDWRNPQQAEHQPVASVDRPQGLLREEVHIPGKSQCDLVLGWPGPSRYEEDYLAAALGNSILGRFGMYGRIGDRVREAAGLAYYSYSSLSGGPGPGAWEVIAGVNPANVEQAIELIRQEVRDFVAEPVSQEELADNQANFIGRLPLQLESNEGVAGALLHAERYELGLDYYRRYPGIIAAIDPGQVLEAARRFLDPDNLVLGVAGPVGEGG
jgi:zinc protease